MKLYFCLFFVPNEMSKTIKKMWLIYYAKFFIFNDVRSSFELNIIIFKRERRLRSFKPSSVAFMHFRWIDHSKRTKIQYCLVRP